MTVICIVFAILTITVRYIYKQTILGGEFICSGKVKCTVSYTSTGLGIWMVVMHILPVWPAPPRPLPSTKPSPEAGCTKNALCPLVALPDSCLPLRSTEDESSDKE